MREIQPVERLVSTLFVTRHPTSTVNRFLFFKADYPRTASPNTGCLEEREYAHAVVSAGAFCKTTTQVKDPQPINKGRQILRQ